MCVGGGGGGGGEGGGKFLPNECKIHKHDQQTLYFPAKDSNTFVFFERAVISVLIL